jgi:hypothetical protein
VAAREVEQRRRARGRSTHGDWKETREGMGRGGWDWVSVPLGFSPWVSLLYGRGEKNGRLRCTNVKIRRLTWSDRCKSPYGGIYYISYNFLSDGQDCSPRPGDLPLLCSSTIHGLRCRFLLVPSAPPSPNPVRSPNFQIIHKTRFLSPSQISPAGWPPCRQRMTRPRRCPSPSTSRTSRRAASFDSIRFC